ncbi:hypothetical protein [Pseudoduganella namucuonensis]|uniref:DUF4351 domain-containing protein n=1 Tax=Pseudoduganella namucuonensis TaxID=1035707 RepID=A0A1I7IVC2_9BURK|nr:hypothetical protein [Pseudoduganella namucuonensis]SFU76848.1 hypothetical protein SAMN05216552_100969 [Pseudoduganella namucuonensis]
MDTPADDYDTPWKTAIMRYFREFMAFCFPAAHGAIDWAREIAFLDQELAQIARDARLGPRRLDKLVRVSALDGGARMLYIHIEVQRSREREFAERMFTYNYRLYDRFRCPIATMAVLADPHPGWRPRFFGYESLGCSMGLHFPAVKLLDFNGRLDALLADENAFALLTAAHLATLDTRHAPAKRQAWKSRLVSLMYERHWDKQRILDWFDVLDWMMMLPEQEQHRFETEIHDLERSYQMPWENNLVRRARQEGREEGREQGREEGLLLGHRETLARLLRLRFGELSESANLRVANATHAELADWEAAILRANTLEDVFRAN